MHTNEKTEDTQEPTETFPPKFCRGMLPPKGIPDCCTGMTATDDCCSMMSKGMKVCRWFPLIPILAGIGLFVLGYHLNAEVARVLCMVAGGTLALFGLLGLMMAGRMKRMCCS
ncbi:MAG: hypothetical protein JSW27_18320 [Phycisphaerales bacterium]|nr:MAG: hypothetical protein JSW27_18320 [Phycisphaerales bacterium]